MLPYLGPMPDVAGDVDTYQKIYGRKYPQQATPQLQPQVFAQAAENTFRRTGTTVPTELALAQAQFETKFGNRGPNAYNNPFNVGVWDNKTVYHPTSQQQGVQAYYDLIADDYLKNRSLMQLLQNFVNTEGKRYASDPDYETKIGDQIKVNRRRLGR